MVLFHADMYNIADYVEMESSMVCVCVCVCVRVCARAKPTTQEEEGHLRLFVWSVCVFIYASKNYRQTCTDVTAGSDTCASGPL